MSASPRRLRLLHVIDGIGIGGGELMLVHLVERLQAAGHDNTVVSLVDPGHLSQRLAGAGATVEALGFTRGRLPGPAAWRLRTAFRRHRPDVVQGWMYHGNLAASVGRLLAGSSAPLVWSMHNSLGPGSRFRWYTRLAMWLGAGLSGTTAAIVYVAAASAPEHERLGFRRDRRVVIPNGIDCDRFRPDPLARVRLRREFGLSDDVALVGLFARWHPMKGHAHLLGAARRLLEVGGSLHLLLAGTEIDLDNRALAAAIDAFGLRRHVSLLGQRDDVEALMPALDIFVLPSGWGEACPLVLGEAMAAGVPCLATDVGDSARIIGDTGLVVPPNDPMALSAALDRLVRSSAAERGRLGRLARQRVIESFSLAETVRRYAELYSGLCTDAAPIEGVAA